ncbi:hypothetical protein A5692_24650 [Mycobacterium sp. E342]|nr:hypothetical protein A5692_24650 [Mycobacterium sp. E342]
MDGVWWPYHRLGAGTAVLWLTGGLRRAALASRFLEGLAAHHAVIAPDYVPVGTVAEFMAAFDAILEAESINTVALVGQSYGGMLAQAYLAHRPGAIDRLILSSTGPADYARGWLALEDLLVFLAEVLPEKLLKKVVASGLVLLTRQLPAVQRRQMADLLRTTVRERLSRADVVSHFAVAADLIRYQIVTPAAFAGWSGRIIVLAAENDPTQSSKDIQRYERLFGRGPEVIGLGQLGHAAALTDPCAYLDLVERALR